MYLVNSKIYQLALCNASSLSRKWVRPTVIHFALGIYFGERALHQRFGVCSFIGFGILPLNCRKEKRISLTTARNIAVYQ